MSMMRRRCCWRSGSTHKRREDAQHPCSGPGVACACGVVVSAPRKNGTTEERPGCKAEIVVDQSMGPKGKWQVRRRFVVVSYQSFPIHSVPKLLFSLAVKRSEKGTLV